MSRRTRLRDRRLTSRIRDEDERARIVEGAWRSMMDQEIVRAGELQAERVAREARTALAQLEGIHPGSLQQLGRTVEVETNAQVEIERLGAAYRLSQHALRGDSQGGRHKRAAIAAYQADLASLNGTLTELRAAYERVVRSRSWLLTRLLRSAVATGRHVLKCCALVQKPYSRNCHR